MTYTLLKSLQSYSDLRVSVILLNQGKLADQLRAIGVEVQVFDENKYPFPLLLLKVRKFIGQFAPDIIHSHRFKENILAYLASRAKKKTSLVVTQHGLSETGKNEVSRNFRLLARFHQKILQQHIDRHVVVSNDILSQVCRLDGFNNKRMQVIHNGIELPSISRPTTSQDILVIGSAGRFVPVKDYSFMVDVAAQVTAKKLPILFRLAGMGPERQLIEQKIVDNSLGNHFRLDGQVEDMATFYKGIDVFINTSRHEGIPMSILESMAHGIPVIAPNVGGIGEIIEDGKDGFLIEGRSLSDFSEKCTQLQRDIGFRKRMGVAAREKIVNKFSSEKMAVEYRNLYLGCVDINHN